MVVDLFLVYQFIRRLATPFNKWEAYKQGIIDDKGKVLIKSKDFTKGSQRKAWGVFDRMIANIKKLLAKIPGGSSKFASYAAALFLIKEYKHFTDESLLNEEWTDKQLDESIHLFSSRYNHYTTLSENVNGNLDELFENRMRKMKLINKIKNSGVVKSGSMSKDPKKSVDTKPEIKEEVPVNNVSGGNIAGMDGGHMSKDAQKKWTKSNKSKKKLKNIMRRDQ